jgi:tetratricopeptide (TPR) repeat protein
MKTRLIIFILLTFLAGVVPVFGSEEAAGLYNRANARYTDKRYQEALALYRELVDRGILNASLYYNLGNTYFKLGEKGKAVLSYERAMRLKPFDRDIRANLRFVKRSLQDQITPLYNERFSRFFSTLLELLTLRNIVRIEIFFFTLAVSLFVLSLFMPSHPLKNVIIVIVVFFIVSLAGVFVKNYQEQNHPHAILMEEIDVRSSPIEESETLFTLHEGAKLRVVEKRGEWVRFRIEDGREGWVRADSFELINPSLILQ